MARPLEGTLVVALEQAVAGPMCTMRLAEAGARVLKVERSSGDFAREYDHVVHGESAYFVWLNRGKESVVLDFAAPDDAVLLHRMIASADVFVQNLAPGAAERAGFGSAELRRRHPRLVTCDISGYGDEGPYRDMKAYDLLVQCETGLASITGAPEGPGRVGVSVADIACGVNAHAGILEALYERTRTGAGKAITVSLFDALADWMTVPLLQFEYGGRAPARAGINHPTIAPYGAYATADGKQLVVAIQNEREWAAFCEGVLQQGAIAGVPAFSSNEGRVANRGALDAAINGVFGALTQDELIGRLRASRVAYGALNGVPELSHHPQLRRTDIETPSGPVRAPAAPIRVRGEAPHSSAVPALNAHGAAIRREFTP